MRPLPIRRRPSRHPLPRGLVAEWSRSGLQIRVLRFESGRGLHLSFPECACPDHRPCGSAGARRRSRRPFGRRLVFVRAEMAEDVGAASDPAAASRRRPQHDHVLEPQPTRRSPPVGDASGAQRAVATVRPSPVVGRGHCPSAILDVCRHRFVLVCPCANERPRPLRFAPPSPPPRAGHLLRTSALNHRRPDERIGAAPIGNAPLRRNR